MIRMQDICPLCSNSKSAFTEYYFPVNLSSVQFSHSVVSNSLQPHGLKHARLPWSTTSSQSSLRLMSIESVMPSISSSVIPFSFCPQSFPASGSFAVSWLSPSGGQSIGASASASVLSVSIQGRE